MTKKLFLVQKTTYIYRPVSVSDKVSSCLDGAVTSYPINIQLCVNIESNEQSWEQKTTKLIIIHLCKIPIGIFDSLISCWNLAFHRNRGQSRIGERVALDVLDVLFGKDSNDRGFFGPWVNLCLCYSSWNHSTNELQIEADDCSILWPLEYSGTRRHCSVHNLVCHNQPNTALSLKHSAALDLGNELVFAFESNPELRILRFFPLS